MDEIENRMAQPKRRRGRPTKAEVAARPQPKEVTSLSLSGCNCPKCGRKGEFKRYKGDKGGKVHLQCHPCGQRLLYVDGLLHII